MNWEAISAIGQIVGAIAVVISLIYLAREIRSNARSARIASLHDVNRWLGELVEHPHLAELYYRGIQDFRSLKSGDLVRLSALMDQAFYIYLSGTVFSAVGRVSRSAPVGSDRSGHARYQRISWSSGLVAYKLASVQ